MISTLSISDDGMMLRSVTPSPFAGISRLPSTSTNVAVGPSPLRLTLACPPLLGLFDVLVNAGTNCGSVLSVDSTVREPLRSKSSSVTETMGLAESKSGRAMRDPVTITCSRSPSWADATPPAMQSAATSAIEARRLGRAVDRQVSGMKGSNQDLATNALRAKRPPQNRPHRSRKAPAQTSFAISSRQVVWRNTRIPHHFGRILVAYGPRNGWPAPKYRTAAT